MLTKGYLYATAVKYQSKSCYVQNVRIWTTLNFIKNFLEKKLAVFGHKKFTCQKSVQRGQTT